MLNDTSLFKPKVFSGSLQELFSCCPDLKLNVLSVALSIVKNFYFTLETE